MNRKLLLTIHITILFALPLLAQTKKISGKVTDAKTGAVLEGVTVRIKSAAKGTHTNADGNYSLKAGNNDILEFSSVGYASQQINIHGRTQIHVRLISLLAELGPIVSVGFRGSGRAKTETPVPVDVINVNKISLHSASMELTSLLNATAPSFNYNKQSGSDGSDQIELATLRGLGPDQTLVLINNKRRHQTAFVAIPGTTGRGNSGTDLNAIPESAINRVEILRDGASAQYGSDAIAGVINIILKKKVNHLQAHIGYAGYYDPQYNTYYKRNLQQYLYSHAIDGNTLSAGINYGLSLGKKNGFINFTGNILHQGRTFRQVLDTNLTHTNGLPINPVRRANGDGRVTAGGAMVNMEIPLGNYNTTLYAFGGYNHRASDAYAYTRTFHGYNSRSSPHPDYFPTDTNGRLIFYPSIMKSNPTPNNIPDTTFNPHIQTRIQDISLSAGIHGSTGNGWKWDLSNTIGKNDFHFYGDKTFNASLGSKTPTHFNDGGFSFLQNTANLTFIKNIPNIGAAFNLALGVEYRYENYKIYAGEEASYANYDPNFMKAAGAQGFPGYRPSDVVSANRSNIAGYIDAEWDISKKLLLGAAIRAENYSDFGFTSNYKLAARYKIAPYFNIRGSINTGYRAPSLQQINYSSQFTNARGGKIVEVKTTPNNNEVTIAAGIPQLRQEKSLNTSVGFSWKPLSKLTITMDGYIVKVVDRVVLSGQFSASDSTLDPHFLATLHSLHVKNAQFFANAINTTNIGLDIVVAYRKKWSHHRLKVLFTGNVQRMTFNKINVPDKLNNSYLHRKAFFSDREEKFVLAAAPPAKLKLNTEYGIQQLLVGTRFTYYGKIVLLGYGYTGDPTKADSKLPGDPNFTGSGIHPLVALDTKGILVAEQFTYNGKIVTELYASYRFSSKISWFLGIDNAFNVHPDLGYVPGAKLSAYDGESGGPWDAVQMGQNGRKLYTKVAFNF